MALWERSAEGLAFPPLSSPRPPLGDGPRGSRQGVTPCTPHRAHWAWGYSNDMQLGRGFTAVARRVPRLAGLVWIPAGWPVQTVVGQQALRLAPKANMI